MNEMFENLKSKAVDALKTVSTRRELMELKTTFLGKSGEITGLMKNMKNLAPEERANFGKFVNALKQEVEEMFTARDKELKEKELEEQYSREAVDITLPGKKPTTGNLHPLNIVKNEIINAFTGMGFEIFEGPEIETDYYCFQALNIPKDHPARDMQDTFYIDEDIVLRSQTSTG